MHSNPLNLWFDSRRSVVFLRQRPIASATSSSFLSLRIRRKLLNSSLLVTSRLGQPRDADGKEGGREGESEDGWRAELGAREQRAGTWESFFPMRACSGRAGEVNSARSANFASMPASPTSTASTANFQTKIDSFSVRPTHIFHDVDKIGGQL